MNKFNEFVNLFYIVLPKILRSKYITLPIYTTGKNFRFSTVSI